MATATCYLYEIAAKEDLPPCIGEGLKMRLTNGLSADPTDDEMKKFFDDYGTHALVRMGMGSKFIAYTSYSK